MILTTPVWSEHQPPPCPPAPRGTLRADTAVIGAGLTGLSAAHHLLRRRPGARLVVLEAGRIGAGASGRTTGLLGPGVGQSLVALVRRQGPARARLLYLATLRAVQDVCRLVQDEGIECELDMTGHLIVACSAADRVRVRAHAALLRAFGLPGAPLDDDALDRVLRLARDRTPKNDGPAALRLPVAGTLHPMRLLVGLAERVQAQGGIIYEGARVTALRGHRPVRLPLHGGGEVLADEVVVASAGYTGELGVLRGRILPVHLQVVATEPLEPRALDVLGWKGREGVIAARRIFNYFRLTRDDRIVFGGGRPRYLWGGRTDDGPRAVRAVDNLAVELDATVGPDVRVAVTRAWTGVIGYVLDSLPCIERTRQQPWVVHALGWCGHGLALSVASGAWVSRILCDGEVPDDLPWHRDRPPLLPFEAARWAGFHAAVRLMALLDRVA